MEEPKLYIKTTSEITEEDDIALRKVLKFVPTISDLEYLKENWVGAKIGKNIAVTVRDTSVAFILAGVDYDTIMLDGVKEVKYPVEVITDKELLEQEIEYENNIFDLEEFYSKSLDGAAVVITKDKMISVYSWIDHNKAVLNIYNYLYDKDPKESEWDGPAWQYEALEKGNIIVQLCDKYTVPVWLPAGMNDFQYDTLREFVEQLKEIDERGSYDIGLALDRIDDNIPIKDAKDKINTICREEGIYDVPKAK